MVPFVGDDRCAVCGAFFKTLFCRSALPVATASISAWMEIIASQKRSSSAFDSLSVGSTIIVPATGQRNGRRVEAVIHQTLGDIFDFNACVFHWRRSRMHSWATRPCLPLKSTGKYGSSRFAM